jgi:hypothetical protein
MHKTLTRYAKKRGKTVAAVAAGEFALANPFFATFLLGAGLALWWAYRQIRPRYATE